MEIKDVYTLYKPMYEILFFKILHTHANISIKWKLQYVYIKKIDNVNANEIIEKKKNRQTRWHAITIQSEKVFGRLIFLTLL